MSNLPVTPSHYRKTSIPPISAIIDWGLGFCLGNVVKYVARAGHKESASREDDLKKALWYLTYETTNSVVCADSVIEQIDLFKRPL